MEQTELKMITPVTQYKVGNKTFDTVEEAQEAEKTLALDALPGADDDWAERILGNAEDILAILAPPATKGKGRKWSPEAKEANRLKRAARRAALKATPTPATQTPALAPPAAVRPLAPAPSRPIPAAPAAPAAPAKAKGSK